MNNWYALQIDKYDNDWGMGSYDFEEAKKICKEKNYKIIAEIKEGSDPICVAEYINGIDF